MSESVIRHAWNQPPDRPLPESERLAHVRHCSPFLNGLFERFPAWIEDAGDRKPPCPQALQTLVETEGLDTAVRRYRNHQMSRIIWRDLCGLANLDETFSDLTRLAEICLDAAVTFHGRTLQEKYGVPTSATGDPQALCVIGLGKFGGGELNLSSDIDIMFCFGENGECTHPAGIPSSGRRSTALTNEQFFVRQARAVINSLGEINEEGFCFRVDVRLRPFGDSGPLVTSLAAMEQYYQREGRDWERYALIKARPVAGDCNLGDRLMHQLQPFVYRRYIDFGAVDALHEMHANVREDAHRNDRLNDIKRGPGGIREIEFLAQCFQLLRGGREPSLQTPSLAQALNQIAELSLLPAATVEEMRADYVFLRQLENRIQALHDQQTHGVPDGLDFERLVQAMQLSSTTELGDRLGTVRQRVETRFQSLFPAQENPVTERRFTEQWRRLKGDQQATVSPPGSSGDQQPADQDTSKSGARPDRPLEVFLRGLGRLALSQRASDRLDQFMPLLLQRLDDRRLDDQTLNRIFDLVLTICRRSAYLRLLVHNDMALDRMIDGFARSQWIAERVTRVPALLDALTVPALGRQIPEPGDLRASVDRLLQTGQGPEAVLEGLNSLRLATTLRIAVAQLQDLIPGETAQQALFDLAAAELQGVLQLAAEEIEARHGQIHSPDEPDNGNSLAIIAYGSFGAGELTYDSDLDIIFLFRGTDPSSDGKRSLPPEQYYARLAQRVLSFLTVMTPAGRLYPVDTRLRPNGRAGSLVSSLEAFSDYQKSQAWTWELQALTRARFVAGNQQTGDEFRRIRQSVLTQARDADVLRTEMLEMRAKMLSERSSLDSTDPKHRPGGLIDIEFLVQFGVLQHAHQHSGLIHDTACLVQLRALQEMGWLSTVETTVIDQAARLLRRERMLRELAPEEERPHYDPAPVTQVFDARLGRIPAADGGQRVGD